jgi:D-glycero-alpha-D-manno-heptose-7-phosphate kinase
MVITKTPFRISFFGGGTDYPLWFRENGGSVLSTSIDKYCYISCRYLPRFFEHNYRFVYSAIETVNNISEIKHPAIKGVLEWMKWSEGIEIHHDGDLPARSGLGSSSTFTVGLINALNAMKGKLTSKYDLAKEAIYVEQEVIKETVGSQDQIAAAYGGFNRIDFFDEKSFTVTPIVIPQNRLEELESHLLLFFTGISRFASVMAKSQLENFASKKDELIRMHQMVPQAIDILSNPDVEISDFGKLLDEAWQYKQSISSKVSNSEINNLYTAARKAGAIGGKLLGAGGGGFFLIFAHPDCHTEIKKALSHLIHVPFRFEFNGSAIALYQPNGF